MVTANKKQNVKKNETSVNSTKIKLKGTPFSTAEELKKAQQEILEETWRKLEKARAKQDLTARDEYAFFVDTFRKGMVCKYGEKDDNLVRVSLESDHSIKISISEEMKSKENSEHLLGVLIESMSSSLLSNYLKAMDIVEDNSEVDQVRKFKNRLKSEL